jgi:hypothetical protein
VAPLPVQVSPLVRVVPSASAAPAAPVRRLLGRSPWAVMGAALAVGLLFALGAARELRWLGLRSRP